MSCCGQKRAALTGRMEQRVLATAPAPTPRTAGNAVVLRYLGTDPLSLRGPRTGRVYYFDAGSAADVAAEDVEPLLRTTRFVRG